MKRKVYDSLLAWKNKPVGKRKPLLLEGARQTGKTWLARELGHREFEELVEVNFEDDEREENTSIFADLNTYYTENYSAFVDCSKPMSEWDSYIQGLYDFGLSDVLENYQTAYDRYQANAM